MSTPLQPSEKQNFIALVRTAPYPGGPDEASRLESILNNYEDVATAIYRQLDLYSVNNAYLKQCILTLNDTNLQAVGIYYNKTVTNPPLFNPVMLVNSTYDDIEFTLTSPPGNYEFGMLGTSRVKKITVDPAVTVNEILIGPGGTVDMLDGAQVSSPPTSPPVSSRVNKIYLPYAKSTPSTLTVVKYGTQIGQVVVDPGSFYGGVQGTNPDLVCSAVVTGIAATELTKRSVYLSWTPPATYTFINTFFRRKGSNVWILATETDGDFDGDSGFTFRHLEENTYYQFKVSTVCTNGGIADVTVTAQTGCCGSGNTMTLYNDCEINVTIKTSPDSSQITLCNGVQIDAQYPAIATLTIPYLIGRQVNRTIILNNLNYQNFPFDVSTGAFNAAPTPLGTFSDDDKVTITALIPIL